MSVMYCASFNQNVVYRGFKGKRSFKQGLTSGAKATKGEETRQLAPESSSNHVQEMFERNNFNRNFSEIFRG